MKPCPKCGGTKIIVIATFQSVNVFTFTDPDDAEVYSDGEEYSDESPTIECADCSHDRSDEFEFHGTRELIEKQGVI